MLTITLAKHQEIVERLTACAEELRQQLADARQAADDGWAAAELARALRWTQEYVGDQMLPPIEGWSWYDALQKHGHYEDLLYQEDTDAA